MMAVYIKVVKKRVRILNCSPLTQHQRHAEAWGGGQVCSLLDVCCYNLEGTHCVFDQGGEVEAMEKESHLLSNRGRTRERKTGSKLTSEASLDHNTSKEKQRQ